MGTIDSLSQFIRNYSSTFNRQVLWIFGAFLYRNICQNVMFFTRYFNALNLEWSR